MTLRTILERLMSIGVLCVAVLVRPASAAAKLYVVTTTPDLAAIAREVGGDKVDAESLALGTQDPHFVDAKPSFILKLNRADLYVKRGLELEIGWAPVLENGARNAAILQGGTRYVDASNGIAPLEVPSETVSRALGDVHPYGNPHFQLDPANAKIIAKNIVEGLSRVDIADQAYFEQRLADFDRRIDEKLAAWIQLLAPYRGAKIVTYHKSWDYFAQRFGFDVIGTMEPKPGVPPSPAHLAQLITLMQAQHCKLVIKEPFYPENLTRVVAEKTGAQVLTLPESPGGAPGTDDYFSFMDYNVKQVAAALAAAKG
ncbi:MAG TPA: metal ABC transporter substrate-binding protein [Candidatus Acidoferrales bacterium]|nr:metal ABC transporter substrate-binding protein [Candidatus Acidoferrales bacterium]